MTLASRQIRLFRLLLSDAHLWAGSTGAHVLRPLVDGLITTLWLLKKDDPSLFLQFKAYGLGKLKLFKLHLEDYLHGQEGEPTDEQVRFLDQLEDEVSSELLEEFVDIDLGGSFAGITIRDMAVEADAKPYYDLAYQPYSSEAHGDWVSLKRNDLQRCANPLHRYHRVGRYSEPLAQPHPEIFSLATDVTRLTVGAVFESYGLSVDEEFDRFTERAFVTSVAA